MLRWNGRNVRMDMLPPLQEDPLRDAQRPHSLLHDSTLMQAASLGCTQKSWQSCQRGFRCVWQRLLNTQRTRSLEWVAAEARRATRFFRAELWINYPNKNRPQRLSSELTSLTVDGSWQLHRKAHKFMVRNAKSSHWEGRWKLKEGKKFKWQKRDDLMRDSPRFVVFYAMKARFESSSEQDRLV